MLTHFVAGIKGRCNRVKKNPREMSILLCKCAKQYYSTFNQGIAVLQGSLQKINVFAIIFFFLLDCIVDIYIQKRGRQH